jgi:DNA adenine methylase
LPSFSAFFTLLILMMGADPSVSLRRPPHPIPYQGSKRRLASVILQFAPNCVDTLLEPFAGSAAVTIRAASHQLAKRYVIADSLEALIAIWNAILQDPECLANDYARIWKAQNENPAKHYLAVRDQFNRSRDNPAQLLYLLARCVKNAVRFNAAGDFNQSADHRRKGMHPAKMRARISEAHKLLNGRTKALCADYAELLNTATRNDLVYLDPPYQGVAGRDPRYFQQLDFAKLIENLERLNSRGVPYLLSLDGACGTRKYGQNLPRELKLTRVWIPAGRSSQSTLSGRKEETTESVYLSPGLRRR